MRELLDRAVGLAVLLLANCVPVVAQTVEHDFPSPEALDPWQVELGEGYEFAWDEDGGGSLRIEREDPDAPNFLANIGRRVDRGSSTVAEVSARVRTEDAGEARLLLLAEDDGGAIAFENMYGEGISGTSDWTSLKTRLAIPTDASSISYGLLLNGRGRAWFDDVVFRAVDTRTLPPAADESADFLAQALDIIEDRALYRERVDWVATRAWADTLIRGTSSPDEAYLAIEYAIDRLDDGHSSIMPPEVRAEWAGESGTPVGPAPSGGLSAEGIAHLVVPTMPTIDVEAETTYANALLEVIEQLAPAATCGWIVDLRQNRGGNMWPMLAGLSPLLEGSPVGGFRDAEGALVEWWVEGGAAGTSTHGEREAMVRASGNHGGVPGLSAAPVAILTGRRTASSGEAAAMAFSGRLNSVRVGEPTRGQSTSNEVFELSDGGALVLTTAVFADRNGIGSGEPLQPDIRVETDSALAAAHAWLKRSGTCAASIG